MPRVREYSDFNDPAFLGELNSELRDVWHQIDRQKIRRRTWTETLRADVETAIPHQMVRTPHLVLVNPMAALKQSASPSGDVGWWMPKEPDAANIYLKSVEELKVMITVEA